jgi:hypothetical protein
MPTPLRTPYTPPPSSPSPHYSPSPPNTPTSFRPDHPTISQTSQPAFPQADDPFAPHPTFFFPPSFGINTDDESSLSSTSTTSLLEPTRAPTPVPMPEILPRRPTKPISAQRGLAGSLPGFPDPTCNVSQVQHAPPPPELPPPLRVAPNDPMCHDFRSKSPGDFRLWSGNVNGLSAKNGYSALEDLCASLKSRHVDAIAISEPNLDFLQAPTREAILKICKSHFEYAQVITSTTCIRAPSTWKPGGTLLIVVKKWAQAVARKTTDDLGR